MYFSVIIYTLKVGVIVRISIQNIGTRILQDLFLNAVPFQKGGKCNMLTSTPFRFHLREWNAGQVFLL